MNYKNEMNYKFEVNDKVRVKKQDLVRHIESRSCDSKGPKYQLANHFLGWHREYELELDNEG